MSSWGRPGPSAASDSMETDLEAQNDQHLNQLHSKLQALRGVTTDIYNDSRNQNSLLDRTSNTFDQFKVSLGNTSTRFARSVASGKGNARIQLGIVGGMVALFLLYKMFGGGSSSVAGKAVTQAEVEPMRW